MYNIFYKKEILSLFFSITAVFFSSMKRKICIFAAVKPIWMKYILAFLGCLSLALGVLGIFLPVLPTTPFLLLSAALFVRSSQRLYAWLMNHRHLGPYIKNFRENRAIPLRVKVISVGMVWLTLLNCAVFVAEEWWMRLLFIAIAACVTVHILRYRTLK